MFRPRIIPVLLLKDKGLVKSVKFKNYKYVGDPINAVKIFNDLRADELVFLDIMATCQKRSIALDFVRRVGDEANMPFAVGGGIQTNKQIKDIINAGAEKVVINSHAIQNPTFIKEAADEFGSSTIVVSIDVKKNMWGKKRVYTKAGTQSTNLNPIEWAKIIEEKGAGEIIINSIDHDGTMNGYDLALVQEISEAVEIPVVALGGAGRLEDLQDAVKKAYASAVAAGSFFVFHGSRKAVLINYPNEKNIVSLFDTFPQISQ